MGYIDIKKKKKRLNNRKRKSSSSNTNLVGRKWDLFFYYFPITWLGEELNCYTIYTTFFYDICLYKDLPYLFTHYMLKKSMCGNMIYNGSALLSAIFRLKLVNNGFLYIHINNNNKKIKELRKHYVVSHYYRILYS